MTKLLSREQVAERLRQHPPAGLEMLDMKSRLRFGIDYEDYRMKQKNPMEPSEWYHIWMEQLKDLECKHCRIG